MQMIMNENNAEIMNEIGTHRGKMHTNSQAILTTTIVSSLVRRGGGSSQSPLHHRCISPSLHQRKI